MTTAITLENLTKIFNELEEKSNAKSGFVFKSNIVIDRHSQTILLPSIDYNQKNKYAKILKLKMQSQLQGMKPQL